MSKLDLQGLSKAYDANKVVDDMSLSFDDGEIVAITGASGCGKTTLLRMIAGLEKTDTGQLFLDGENITFLAPEKRNIGLVFQDLALFPHLTVAKNIGFALQGEKKTQEKRVKELLEMIGLKGFEERYPHQLSGGQQQRVALARAVAKKPKILLLDEPFSNLDDVVKTKVRHEVLKLVHEFNITTLIVTHHASDAFMISNRTIFLHKGKVLQDDTPVNLYQKPKSTYVSDFFGSSVILEASASEGTIQTGFGFIDAKVDSSTSFQLFVRPEKIMFSPSGNLSGIVREKIFKGPHEVLLIENKKGDDSFYFETEISDWSAGDEVQFVIKSEDVLIF